MSVQIHSPYPGLRPFQDHESVIFFGRGEQVADMLSELETHRFLAVVGASGSGKSSLVRAGLLPALQEGFLAGAEEQWRFVKMSPGAAPFSNLAREFLRAIQGREPDPEETAFAEAHLRRGRTAFAEAVAEERLPEGTNVLLLVDQFEEIFRFRRRLAKREEEAAESAGSLSVEEKGRAEEEERQILRERNDANAFVNLMLTTAQQTALPIYVVLTMRSDFIGYCDSFHGMPEAMNKAQFLTPRMRRDQSHDAITGPLKLFGASASPELVNEILNEIGSDPDQLPLMQHFLARLWSTAAGEAGADKGATVLAAGPGRRKRRPESESLLELTLDDYEEGEGLHDALSAHATEAYDELGDADGGEKKRVAEVMFRSLVERGDEGQLIRRNPPPSMEAIAEVAGVSWERVKEVTGPFLKEGRSFIYANPRAELRAETTLDISHEALIRQWGLLHDWAGKEARDAEQFEELAKVASRWRKDEKKAGLWRPPELDLALQWWKEARPTENWAKRYGGDFAAAKEFLFKSKEAQKKSRIRAGATIAALVLLGIGVLVGAVLAARADARRAQVEKGVAIVEKGAAEDREKAIQAKLQSIERLRDYDEARKLQDRASEVLASGAGENTDTQAFLYSVAALARLPAEQRLALSAGRLATIPMPRSASGSAAGSLQDCARSADGRLVGAAIGSNVYLWDMQTGEPFATLRGHQRDVRSISFASDGTRLASGSDDGTVRIWNLAGDHPKLEKDLPPYGSEVYTVSFSGDGKWLAAGYWDGDVRIWSASDFASDPILIRGEYDSVKELSFDTIGEILGAAYSSGTILVWDWRETEVPVTTLREEGRRLRSVSLDGTGRWLAYASVEEGENSTGRAVLLNRQEGSSVSLKGATEATSVSLSREGGLLASASGREIQLWDTSGRPQRTLEGAAGYSKLSWAGDGRWLMGMDSSAGSSLTFWRPEVSPRPSAELRRASPSEKIDGAAGTEILSLKDEEGASIGLRSFRVSSRGTFLGVGGEDGRVHVWTRKAGGQWERPPAKKEPEAEGKAAAKASHEGNVLALAFDQDEKWMVSTSDDATAKLWQVGSEDGPFVLPKTTGFSINCAAFEGERFVLGDNAGNIQVWKAGQPAVMFGTLGTDIDEVDIFGNKVVSSAVFDKKGRLLVGYKDGSVRRWSAALSPVEKPERFRCHTKAVTTMRFSRSGNWLATASSDGTIKLWKEGDLSQPPQLIFVGSIDSVLSIDFSPEEEWLVAGRRGGQIEIFQLGGIAESGSKTESRDAVASRDVRSGPVHGVKFVSAGGGGLQLITAGGEGAVKEWHLNLDFLRDYLGPRKTIGAIRDAALALSGYRLEEETLELVPVPARIRALGEFRFPKPALSSVYDNPPKNPDEFHPWMMKAEERRKQLQKEWGSAKQAPAP